MGGLRSSTRCLYFDADGTNLRPALAQHLLKGGQQLTQLGRCRCASHQHAPFALAQRPGLDVGAHAGGIVHITGQLLLVGQQRVEPLHLRVQELGGACGRGVELVALVVREGGRTMLDARWTEAYLHALSDEGQWRPVCLDDGLVSDGKVETYSRCVESICGSADTFFTSAFSAQGKRQLSTYRNAEIKSLLSDLLGQEEIRALGQRANDTAKLIKAGLSAISLAVPVNAVLIFTAR